jgi:hypothetical protein
LLENDFFGRLADNVAPLCGMRETCHFGRSTEYEVLAAIVKWADASSAWFCSGSAAYQLAMHLTSLLEARGRRFACPLVETLAPARL